MSVSAVLDRDMDRDLHQPTFRGLERHVLDVFPALEGIGFTWPPEPLRLALSKAILGYMHAEDAWTDRRPKTD